MSAAVLAGCAGSGSHAPAPHRNALVYRNSSGEIVVASWTGRTERTLGPAAQALVSPDGVSVLALDSAADSATLTLYRTARASNPRVLATVGPPDWAGATVKLLGWSPDARYVLMSVDALSATGEEGALVVLDVATGSLQRIAIGTFLGASFAPTLPDRIVYSRASLAQLDDNESLLYVTDPFGRDTRELTTRGLASSPVWSSRGIFFARLVALGSTSSSPRYGLWLVRPDGRGLDRIGAFSGGPPAVLAAPAISVSLRGRRAVADFYSPAAPHELVDAWEIDLTSSGSASSAVRVPIAGGFAEGISRDGKYVLVLAKGSGASEVESIRWGTGGATVLALPGTDPTWNH